MRVSDFKTAQEIAEILDKYTDTGKLKILSILAAALGYKLVKHNEEQTNGND